MNREPGARPVAGYELDRLLGRGGFGEVWKARAPGGFAVALKFIRLDQRAAAVELRSLELMKDIRHPHLLGLFGAWQQDEHLIVAMELADRTLQERWQKAAGDGHAGIPGGELLRYMREAAAGLDHLNGLGLQHRDIKPQNLLLVGGGVKVADFGLAKLLENSITSHTGAMTPAFAAPEFLDGRTSSHSDQYSLAVSYCQLRGGRLPFTGTPGQVLTGHLMHPPDLTMLPDGERVAVGRALAKAPDQRWPSCREFVEALARSSDGKDPPPSPRVAVPAPTLHVSPPHPAPTPTEVTGEVTNSVGMRLVPIPAGQFLMGSPRDEPGRGADEEPHRLRITRPFHLGVYAVTQEEYETLMGANPSWFTRDGSGKSRVARLDTRRFPVEMVTWREADEFCRRLSELPAERRAGRAYRLPTEAEWEYACRAGGRAQAAFHVGPTLSSWQANFDGGKGHGGVPEGPYLRRTAEVGSYPPNAFGLYDLHGNVLEWCADWYGRDYYGQAPEEDPPGPAAGPGRVARGGAWSYGAAACRSACRTVFAPGTRNGNIGFRVVCELPG